MKVPSFLEGGVGWGAGELKLALRDPNPHPERP